MKTMEEFKHDILNKQERYLTSKKASRQKAFLVIVPAMILILCFTFWFFPVRDTLFTPAESNNADNPITSEKSANDIKSVNLMSKISAKTVNTQSADERFISSTANFAVNLFQQCTADHQNTLISPLSAMLALSMTANGADGNTRTQMEKVLGGGMSINELNEYLTAYVKNLENDDTAKLSIANSIWFRKGFSVNKSFLQTNADYYGAAAYQSPFNEQTRSDINQWVYDSTDGLIDSFLDDSIDDNVKLYLINALVFEAQWEEPYNEEELRTNGVFTAADGSEETVTYMCSDESLFLDDGMATGFIKPYAGGNYSFVALLPNEGVSIDEYVSSLTGDKLIQTIQDAETDQYSESVWLPQFSVTDAITMNDALQKLGMTDVFSDTADFTQMSSEPGLYINRVMQKTFITVTPVGTKAGAATGVEMQKASISLDPRVKLNRPFVYAIIDNTTDLPIFIGTVMSIGE